MSLNGKNLNNYFNNYFNNSVFTTISEAMATDNDSDL